MNISEAEWKIMELLWKTPMLTIGEIKSALKDTGWNDSTIKTLVRRLNQKGAIGADASAGQFRYYPLLSENNCRLKEARNLINRVYNGSVKLLMANLVSDSNLSEEEVQTLMNIIDKMEE